MSEEFTVSVIVATFGHTRWQQLARTRALPSVHALDPRPREDIELHHVNGTLAEVRNAGAKIATGDWLCFVDADDELAPGYLAVMKYAAMVAAELGIAPALLVPSAQYVRAPRHDGDTGYETEPCIPDWERPLNVSNCAVIGTLMPRTLFAEVGGFREWPIFEDWDLTMRCVEAGATLVAVCDAVYRAHDADYSMHRGGGRNVGPEAAETYRRIRAEHLERLPDYPWSDVASYKVDLGPAATTGG